MTRRARIATGVGAAAVVATITYVLGGQLMNMRAEGPPEFEVSVETSAPNAVAYLNGDTVTLAQSGGKWTARRNNIGARDSVTRVLEIHGISNTDYKFELKHYGVVVDSESGATDAAEFRSPTTGTKTVRLKPAAVANDD